MLSLSSTFKKRFCTVVTALITCVGVGQAVAQTATPVPDPHKIQAASPPLAAPSFDFSAEPVGKYSIRVNTPAYKEYDAYTRWGATYSTDGTMTVKPFVGAQSVFSASLKKRDGQDFFANQKYEWTSSAATYIPVLPPPPPDENAEILLRREAIKFGDDVNSAVANLLPLGMSIQMRLMTPSSLLPEWYEHAVWQDELAANTGAYPAEWDIHTSTATKRLFWNNGNQVDNIPPTTVTVKVSDGQGVDPRVANGKIKINWHRPPQTVYDITLLPVEWQIPPPEEQVGGAAGNYIYTELSDAKLLANLGHYAGVQAVWIVVTEAGGQVFRVVFTSRIGSAAVAKLFGNVALGAGLKNTTGAEAQAIGNNLGKAEVWATEIGANGAAVETATSRQSVRIHTEEGHPPTLQAEGEPTINSRGGHCFVAGTPVVMADGSTKAIERVRVGDLVLSRDPLTGQVASKKVTRTYIRQAPSTVVLGLGDGQKLEVTPEHPVFVMEAGSTPRWKMIPAGHVAIGTSIQTRAGPELDLKALTHNNENRTVFNFTVADFHTYFVGKSPHHALWVHNANPDSYPLNDANESNLPHDSDAGDGLADHDASADVGKTPGSLDFDPRQNGQWERGHQNSQDAWDNLVPDDRTYKLEGTGEYRERTIVTSEATRIDNPGEHTFDPTISGGKSLNNPYAPTGKNGQQFYPGKKLQSCGADSLNSDSPTFPATHADPKTLDQWYDFANAHPNGRYEFHMDIKHSGGGGPCADCHQRIKDFVTKYEGQHEVVVTYGKGQSRKFRIYMWDGQKTVVFSHGDVD
ncbi:hypothetical protein IAD21_03792 [Abditibacteriota bacterium]|nr:hypothetical protein IAD21_03792 [Abditibacteriota bacterium]